MAHNSWDDLGEEIKDAVNDAVSSGDFADLGRSIGDLVNSTLYVVGKGVTDSVRQASRMASEMESATLSGWPLVTHSEVNSLFSIIIPFSRKKR